MTLGKLKSSIAPNKYNAGQIEIVKESWTNFEDLKTLCDMTYANSSIALRMRNAGKNLKVADKSGQILQILQFFQVWLMPLPSLRRSSMKHGESKRDEQRWPNFVNLTIFCGILCKGATS